MGKLEDIIRQKALRAKPYQPTPDWDRMASMLDQEDSKVAAFWKRPGYWALGILLLLVLGLGAWHWMPGSQADSDLLADQATMEPASTPSLSHPKEVKETPAIEEPELVLSPSVVSATSTHSPTSTTTIPASTNLNTRTNPAVSHTPPATALPQVSSQSSPSQTTQVVLGRGNESETEVLTIAPSSPQFPIEAPSTRSPEERRKPSPPVLAQSTGISIGGLEKHIFLLPLASEAFFMPAPARLSMLSIAPASASKMDRLNAQVRMALSAGEQRNWTKSRWTTDAALTATNFSMDVLADSTMRTFDVVMPGIGINLSRRWKKRWEFGAALDVGTFHQIGEINPGQFDVPVNTASLTARSFVYLDGNVQDVSLQSRFHFVKNREKRFHPYWIGGLGMHFKQFEISGLEGGDQYLNSRSSMDILDFTTTQSDLALESGYLTNYQKSLSVINAKPNPENLISLGRNYRFAQAMAYTGVGVEVRVHRRVSAFWQLTIHATRSSASTREGRRLFASFNSAEELQEPNPSSDNSGNPNQQNLTPSYLRQTVGIRIAL